jgi:hypothetical protein
LRRGNRLRPWRSKRVSCAGYTAVAPIACPTRGTRQTRSQHNFESQSVSAAFVSTSQRGGRTPDKAPHRCRTTRRGNHVYLNCALPHGFQCISVRFGPSRGYQLDTARCGFDDRATQFAGGTLGCTLQTWASLHLTWYDVRRDASQIATAPTYYGGLCNEHDDWPLKNSKVN